VARSRCVACLVGGEQGSQRAWAGLASPGREPFTIIRNQRSASLASCPGPWSRPRAHHRGRSGGRPSHSCAPLASVMLTQSRCRRLRPSGSSCRTRRVVSGNYLRVQQIYRAGAAGPLCDGSLGVHRVLALQCPPARRFYLTIAAARASRQLVVFFLFTFPGTSRQQIGRCCRTTAGTAQHWDTPTR